jgi:dipeptidyl aminopeptidase/acylaminoacyl peptidase
MVIIQVSGKAPLSVKTGANGSVTITIDPNYLGQSGELIVEADGFQEYRTIVDLVEGGLPAVIELERSPTPLPSPPRSGKLAVPLKLGNEFRVYLVEANSEGVLAGSFLLSNARQPLFSPDSQSLVAVGTGGNFAGVFRVDRNGQSPQRLDERNLAHWPVWSPDGSQIIFADLGLDNGKLLRQSSQGAFTDADFTEVRANNITLVGRNLIWTEQNQLVFRECAYWIQESGTCGIWVTDADTPNPQRVVPTLDFPIDAKNGLLVYLSNSDGDWDIYLVPFLGGQPQNLTNNGVNVQDGLAAFSPDGRSIAYVSNESGVWAVWTITLSNLQKRQWFALDPQLGTIDLNIWAEERMSWAR